MSEKRFTLMLPNAVINDTIVRKSYYLSEKDDVEKLVDCLNEQQDTISQLEKNFDDIVKWASEIAKRNVELDEKIGKIQQAIRISYEKKPYPTIEDIQKEINNE